MFSKELFSQLRVEPANEKPKALLTREEYDKLLGLLERKKKTQLKMMIQLMSHSGMRISEVINLKV